METSDIIPKKLPQLPETTLFTFSFTFPVFVKTKEKQVGGWKMKGFAVCTHWKRDSPIYQFTMFQVLLKGIEVFSGWLIFPTCEYAHEKWENLTPICYVNSPVLFKFLPNLIFPFCRRKSKDFIPTWVAQTRAQPRDGPRALGVPSNGPGRRRPREVDKREVIGSCVIDAWNILLNIWYFLKGRLLKMFILRLTHHSKIDMYVSLCMRNTGQ